MPRMRSCSISMTEIAVGTSHNDQAHAMTQLERLVDVTVVCDGSPRWHGHGHDHGHGIFILATYNDRQ